MNNLLCGLALGVLLASMAMPGRAAGPTYHPDGRPTLPGPVAEGRPTVEVCEGGYIDPDGKSHIVRSARLALRAVRLGNAGTCVIGADLPKTKNRAFVMSR